MRKTVNKKQTIAPGQAIETEPILPDLVSLPSQIAVEPPQQAEFSLHEAVKKGFVELVEAILNAGAQVNAPTPNGSTPLHLACIRGHQHIAELLIEHGAHLNYFDQDGFTPLHFAAGRGNLPLVKLLLNNGASPSYKTFDKGLSPLDLARQKKRLKVIEMLLGSE